MTASESEVFCLRLSDVLIIIIVEQLVQQLVISFRPAEGRLQQSPGAADHELEIEPIPKVVEFSGGIDEMIVPEDAVLLPPALSI